MFASIKSNIAISDQQRELKCNMYIFNLSIYILYALTDGTHFRF